MSLTLHLVRNAGRRWHRHGQAAAKGFAFRGGVLLDGPALAAAVDQAGHELPAFVAGLSGTFAVAWVDAEAGRAHAAVDRIRSTPLFYGGRYLSDDAHWVADQTQGRAGDPVATASFLLQGQVIGAATLIDTVRQVQAGEVASFEAGGWTTTRYFQYGDAGPVDADKGEGVEAGRAALETAFGRMLQSVGDRPLVVPLSGGLDSRLVAFMLARMGRTDTLCFSYGRRAGFEAQTSQRVARALGLRWAFVPYTNRQWHHWYHTPGYQQYRKDAAQLSAIEHEQDWPAVLTLKQQGLLPEGAVFVPGHSGDFIAGSHLPETLFQPGAPLDPADWIWRKYFRLFPQAHLPASVRAQVLAAIRATWHHQDPKAPWEAARLFEQYGWQERQAKMIVNSVRAYEHHGFDWRVPLWDAALLDYWPQRPLADRHHKRHYLALLKTLMGPIFEIPFTPPPLAGLREKLRRVRDLDYRRYGMYLGPNPWRTALTERIKHGPTLGDPIMHSLVTPLKHYPLQALPLNALTAWKQWADVYRAHTITS